MAGSDYLLIECDFGEDPWVLRSVLKGLLERSVIPIVAHPERYYFAHDSLRYLFDYVDMGCVLQLDTESITGAFGRECTEREDCKAKIAQIKGLYDELGVPGQARSEVRRYSDMALEALKGLRVDITPLREFADKLVGRAK